jgi:hypothetical protein
MIKGFLVVVGIMYSCLLMLLKLPELRDHSGGFLPLLPSETARIIQTIVFAVMGILIGMKCARKVVV